MVHRGGAVAVSAPKELWAVINKEGDVVTARADKTLAERIAGERTGIGWQAVPYVPRTPLTDAAGEMLEALRLAHESLVYHVDPDEAADAISELISRVTGEAP